MSDDLLTAGAAAVASAVANGETTAEAVTKVALDRLETRGRRYNGVVLVEAERALAQAREVDLARRRGAPLGSLAGVPMAHKDLFYRVGRSSSCGSKIREGFMPAVTSTALTRLDEAGAIDCGTLHMAEFALSPTGYNLWYGDGCNPWNPAHICGGSSSGSGIAVSTACVPAALGTDTGGSIRHPAAMCGVAGLKPTYGGVSLYGAMPLARSLDCIGPIGRRARDLARIHDVLAGPDPWDPSTRTAPKGRSEAALTGDVRTLRMGTPRGYYAEALHEKIAEALAEAEKTLGDLGVAAVETSTPDVPELNALMQLVMAVEAATLHRRWLESRPEDYADQVRARIEPGLHYMAPRYVEALALRGPLANQWVERVLKDCDFALLPAIPVPVPSIEATRSGTAEDVGALIGDLTRNTRAINYLGLPAVALPCGFCSGGLPIGMQLVGRPWSEPILLRVADAFERVTPWHRRIPAC